jgi:hypothetical protein
MTGEVLLEAFVEPIGRSQYRLADRDDAPEPDACWTAMKPPRWLEAVGSSVGGRKGCW